MQAQREGKDGEKKCMHARQQPIVVDKGLPHLESEEDLEQHDGLQLQN